MTATDELCLPNDTNELDMLLSERGQEHRVWPSGLVVWHDERMVYEYEPAKNHHDEYWGGILRMTMRHLTPEQAIAATLGDVPRLPYFWTADGTLHIELPRLPESISVRLPEQRDREVGSARVWQYTRDSGTLTAEQVREAWCGHLRRDCLYDPPTPDWQAIADELNAALGVNGATGKRRDDARPCREVYLVEVSDDLLESWYTIAVYQCREAAESRAEALRREVDGVRHFARVSKLEVVDE